MPEITNSANYAETTRVSTLPFAVGFGGWLFSWIVGSALLGGAIFAGLGYSDATTAPVAVLALAMLAGWSVSLMVLVVLSRHSGSGSFVADYGVKFRVVDLLGFPLGVAGQLAIIPAVYYWLRRLWPDVFDSAAVAKRAEQLVAGVDGVGLVALGALIMVGAPVVEELLYRGMLQRSAAAKFGRWAALVMISVLFAVIHLSPVEIPGLFIAGSLFGVGLAATDRVGMGIAAHIGFNATAFIALV